ncbi:sulfate permease-like protein [Stipitochalara longipes BDJ]|nr:sulfate permease-like protein [Stipitochalara longipes BDJ]
MGFVGTKVAALKQDANFSRIGQGVVLGARGLRAGTGRYFSNKVPIVQWITGYVPNWFIGDAIAGSSVGMLLFPQAVMYSTLAGVPVQQALLASWLPGIIYTIMGTTKDVSTGPTSTTALLTGQIVLSLAPFKVPPPLVAAVVSFCIGIWSMILGVLNFGFIFDLLSLPMVLGLLVAIGNVVIVSQLPTILGLTGISPVFIEMMPQILKKIGQSKPTSIGLAAVSIVLLAILQFVGKKWGHKSEILRILSVQRNLLIISIFTAVSFFMNKDLAQPLWQIVGPIKTELPAPQVPIMALVQGLFVPSLALAITIMLEHVAFAKGFGRKNGYSINASQEMFYLGVINVVNSFFGGMPVGGGDLPRAAVNSASGVRSPLGGIFTSVTVLGGMYAGSAFLQYIPMPTIAAVILVATIDQMPPMAYMGKFWRISFTDFGAFLMTFNVAMLASNTVGIGLGLVIMIFYTIFRLMFSRPSNILSIDLESIYSSLTPPWWSKDDRIPPGTQVISLETDVIFVNAERIKRHVVNTALTYQFGIPITQSDNLQRAWNYRRDKHVERLRRLAGVSNTDTFIPRLRVLVLDLSATSFVDASGMQTFEDIKHELRSYGGPRVEMRFVGLNKGVQNRFKRAGWKLASPYDEEDEPQTVEEEIERLHETKDLIFEHLPHAVMYQPQGRPSITDFDFDDDLDLKKH